MAGFATAPARSASRDNALRGGGKTLKNRFKPVADREPPCIRRKTEHIEARAGLQAEAEILNRPTLRKELERIAQLGRLFRVIVILLRAGRLAPACHSLLRGCGGFLTDAGRVGPEDDGRIADPDAVTRSAAAEAIERSAVAECRTFRDGGIESLLMAIRLECIFIERN